MYTVTWLGCRSLRPHRLHYLQRDAEREALRLARTASQAITLRQAVLAPLNKRNVKRSSLKTTGSFTRPPRRLVLFFCSFFSFSLVLSDIFPLKKKIVCGCTMICSQDSFTGQHNVSNNRRRRERQSNVVVTSLTVTGAKCNGASEGKITSYSNKQQILI